VAHREHEYQGNGVCRLEVGVDALRRLRVERENPGALHQNVCFYGDFKGSGMTAPGLGQKQPPDSGALSRLDSESINLSNQTRGASPWER
jgi:hypothetical protein